MIINSNSIKRNLFGTFCAGRSGSVNLAQPEKAVDKSTWCRALPTK